MMPKKGRLPRSPSCVSHRRNTGQREKYDLLVFASFFRGHDGACALLSFAHVGVSSLTALHVSFMFTFQMLRRTGNLTALPTHTHTPAAVPLCCRRFLFSFSLSRVFGESNPSSILSTAFAVPRPLRGHEVRAARPPPQEDARHPPPPYARAGMTHS